MTSQVTKRSATFKDQSFHLDIGDGITLTLKRFLQEQVFMQTTGLISGWNLWTGGHPQKPEFPMENSCLMVVAPGILDTVDKGNLASATSRAGSGEVRLKNPRQSTCLSTRKKGGGDDPPPLFPLDCPWGLAGNVQHNPVDTRHLIDNPIGDDL